MTIYTADFGITSSGLTLSAGDALTVLSGGTADNTTIDFGAVEYVLDGNDNFAAVSSGGRQTVSGGTVAGATITAAGLQVVDGGEVISTAVQSGGQETVAGGTVEFTSVASSGLQTVTGGHVVSAAIASAGIQNVFAGQVDFTTVSGGGSEHVGGGLVSGTTLDGGASQSISAGEAHNTVVGSGATQTVAGGGAFATMVLSGGMDVVSGGILSGSAIASGGMLTVSSGGVLHATISAGGVATVLGGSVTSTFVNGGSLALMGGVLSASVVSGGGVITVSGGSDMGTLVQGGGTETIAAGGFASGSVLTSGGFQYLTSAFTQSATDLTGGGAITLGFLAYDASATSSFDASTDTLTITDAAGTTQLSLAGVYASDQFRLSADGANDTLVTVACYGRGTRIATPDGEIAVEDLRAGDTVTTHDNCARPIHWIGRRSYAGRFLAGQRHLLPIWVAAGALGQGIPRRDLQVSPMHALYLDGFLVPAGELVNGTTIVQMTAIESVEYFHIELATHDVLWAEGAPSESYVADGRSAMFHNAGERPALPSDAAPPTYFAPRISQGFDLEAIRSRLTATAASRPRAA